MKKNFIEELRWRGMLADMMPGTEEVTSKEMVTAYVGFDPTAKSLHIGNLATLMLLVHLQRCGHKPVALVGGATGMVGDPSFKAAERKLLDEATLAENVAGIRQQLEKFLDFNSGANSAVMVNNYDWMKDFGFLGFLRDVGKHITVNYMMAKDSVKKRLETGLSFTEFSYQLLQGYDFQYLNKNLGVKLQMGGSDQWGNITTGTELIRRMHEGEGEAEAYALTTPLITKADGTKFGKSEGGNIWLDAELTSPYQFYQFLLNTADTEAERLVKVFCLREKEEILAAIEQHNQDPGRRVLQYLLAEDLTRLVHGQEELDKAIKASNILFGKSSIEDLQSLDERLLLQLFEGVPQVTVPASALDSDVTTFLATGTEGQIFASKGEARKMITGGGVSINNAKVDAADASTPKDLLQGKYLLVRKGKKNYVLVTVAQ